MFFQVRFTNRFVHYNFPFLQMTVNLNPPLVYLHDFINLHDCFHYLLLNNLHNSISDINEMYFTSLLVGSDFPIRKKPLNRCSWKFRIARK